MKSAPCDSPVLLGGVTKGTQVTRPGNWGVTSWDLGLRHTARVGEERRWTSACLMLLLWELLSRGKTLQILQLAEPSRHPAHKRARTEAAAFPVLPGRSCAGRSAGARGNPLHGGMLPSPLCSWSLWLPSGNTFPPALVPRNILLTPCFCATLLALPLAKFLHAVPSERHNSLFTYLFLLSVYELSKERSMLRKISFPLALWTFSWQKLLRNMDSGPSWF